MLPKRLKVYNFRSIGAEGVDLGELKKANIIIGRNNSGKSNVVRAWAAAVNLIRSAASNGRLNLGHLDRHRRDDTLSFRIEVDLPVPEGPNYSYFAEHHDSMRFQIELNPAGLTAWSQQTLQYEKDSDLYYEWWRSISGFRSGVIDRSQITRDIDVRIAEYLRDNANSLSEVVVIPEFRQIRDTQGEYNINGENLVLTLAKLKNPQIGRDSDILKFRKIENFFKRLLDLSDDAHISVSTDNPTIIVENRGIRLPIDSYGTGVHQLIILLTAVLSNEDRLYGIEEPEIHLHSHLQKAFIDFLINETSNRYIITTHSPSIINMPFTGSATLKDAISIVALTNDGSGSAGQPITESQAMLDAINDIGINASDLLQATGIIWVEGPSDRVYLNRWIALRDPKLIEGIHYHFMYYGGKLLSHYEVKADDEEVTGLINLLRVNRNCMVVIDSDKRTVDAPIAEFKTRIRAEAEASGITCWITDGREIENYVHEDAVNKAFSEKVQLNYFLGQFDKIDVELSKATNAAGVRERKYENSKVQYSKRIAEHIQKIHAPYDLEVRMTMLINLVRRWNSLPPLNAT